MKPVTPGESDAFMVDQPYSDDQVESDISALFAQLPVNDIEQFYNSYQLWLLEQRRQELITQIAAVRHNITANNERIDSVMPSAIALASLARLQSCGVTDVGLLDTMLARGDTWLDHTMQLLERCEALDVIQGDYTEWCEHALEGAYDWIESVQDNSQAFSSEDQLIQEENENSDISSPDDNLIESNEELRPATEERLLQILMSDDDELQPVAASFINDELQPAVATINDEHRSEETSAILDQPEEGLESAVSDDLNKQTSPAISSDPEPQKQDLSDLNNTLIDEAIIENESAITYQDISLPQEQKEDYQENTTDSILLEQPLNEEKPTEPDHDLEKEPVDSELHSTLSTSEEALSSAANSNQLESSGAVPDNSITTLAKNEEGAIMPDTTPDTSDSQSEKKIPQQSALPDNNVQSVEQKIQTDEENKQTFDSVEIVDSLQALAPSSNAFEQALVAEYAQQAAEEAMARIEQEELPAEQTAENLTEEQIDINIKVTYSEDTIADDDAQEEQEQNNSDPQNELIGAPIAENEVAASDPDPTSTFNAENKEIAEPVETEEEPRTSSPERKRGFLQRSLAKILRR